jgi:hypothetical protein
MAVTDLSALADGSLSMGCSQAGGNVISDVPWGGSVGSASEQTADLPYEPQHNNPELDLGTVADHAEFVHSGTDDAFAAHDWTPAYSDVRP